MQRLKKGWKALFVAAATAGAFLWFSTGARVTVAWSSVMDFLEVHNRDRYTKLAILGVVVCAVLALFRILQSDETD